MSYKRFSNKTGKPNFQLADFLRPVSLLCSNEISRFVGKLIRKVLRCLVKAFDLHQLPVDSMDFEKFNFQSEHPKSSSDRDLDTLESMALLQRRFVVKSEVGPGDRFSLKSHLKSFQMANN